MKEGCGWIGGKMNTQVRLDGCQLTFSRKERKTWRYAAGGESKEFTGLRLGWTS